MASRKYRDVVNPITSKDWFLYHLFNDEEFSSMRIKWRSEIDAVDSGEPGREGLPFLEQEKITERYVGLIVSDYDVSEDVARSGLSYTDWGRVINKNRVPVVRTEGDRILIDIGSDTRLEDIEHLWRIRIDNLQKDLPGYTSSRSVPSSQPLLAYIVYKHRLEGRKMVEIHKNYVEGVLDNRIPAHPNSVLEDFRKYYKDTVQGYTNTA